MSPRISASKYLRGDEFPPDETSKVAGNYFLMLSPLECSARYRSSSTFRQQIPNIADICFCCFFFRYRRWCPGANSLLIIRQRLMRENQYRLLKLSRCRGATRVGRTEKSSSGNINRDRRTESNDFFSILFFRALFRWVWYQREMEYEATEANNENLCFAKNVEMSSRSPSFLSKEDEAKSGKCFIIFFVLQ